MARVLWPFHHNRPSIQVTLVPAAGGSPVTRTLLPDTGAGSLAIRFHLLLPLADCLLCGGVLSHDVNLGGAYRGKHRVYLVYVEIPGLAFRGAIWAAAIAKPPQGFDGLAGFRFLNRFTYGNFGDKRQFGLEC